MTTAVIDRFEDDKAVLLVGKDEQEVVFPRQELPNDLNEGDYLRMDIFYDAEMTKKAMKESMRLLDELKGTQS